MKRNIVAISWTIPTHQYEAVLRAVACFWFAPFGETMMTSSEQVAAMAMRFVEGADHAGIA